MFKSILFFAVLEVTFASSQNPEVPPRRTFGSGDGITSGSVLLGAGSLQQQFGGIPTVLTPTAESSLTSKVSEPLTYAKEQGREEMEEQVANSVTENRKKFNAITAATENDIQHAPFTPGQKKSQSIVIAPEKNDIPTHKNGGTGDDDSGTGNDAIVTGNEAVPEVIGAVGTRSQANIHAVGSGVNAATDTAISKTGKTTDASGILDDPPLMDIPPEQAYIEETEVAEEIKDSSVASKSVTAAISVTLLASCLLSYFYYV